MAQGAEMPESALCELGALPLIVSCQVNVLPAERGKILEQFRVEGLPVARYGLDCPLDVHGVPERYGGGDESEATGAVALLLEAPDRRAARQSRAGSRLPCVAG